ncbi:helix-turn-helix domain-containing protein, partial [Streptomyces venezuelae]
MAGDEFAALLGRLKERSGLSYGALGKRLHLSASTLHRYVNGDAVPVDYAPVERLARLCRATPDELVELHRLWVRADVSRQRKTPAPEPAPAPAPEATAGPETEPEPET